MVGFHLMMMGLWNQIVAPPSTMTSASVIHNIRWIGRRVSLSTVTWISVMTLITIVPSSTGASSTPTMPPETMKPSQFVASAAAHSLFLSAYWKVPKKRISGRKSRNSFIRRCGSLRRGLEVYRRRVDAEPLARRLRPVLEHMAEGPAAPVGPGLHADHAMALVDHAPHPPPVDRL